MFDKIHDEVAEKTSVPDSTKALVENMVLEFQARADDLNENASADAKKLASEVKALGDKFLDEASAFGDSVMKNVELPKAPAEGAAPMKTPLYKEGEEMPDPAPLHETAQMLVDNGMDVKTANSMTGPGSNI